MGREGEEGVHSACVMEVCVVCDGAMHVCAVHVCAVHVCGMCVQWMCVCAVHVCGMSIRCVCMWCTGVMCGVCVG